MAHSAETFERKKGGREISGIFSIGIFHKHPVVPGTNGAIAALFEGETRGEPKGNRRHAVIIHECYMYEASDGKMLAGSDGHRAGNRGINYKSFTKSVNGLIHSLTIVTKNCLSSLCRL